MSRKAAKLISGCVSALTIPLSKRQRVKTIARVIDTLNADAWTKTPQGLLFKTLASPDVASAVKNFGVDEPETLAWINTLPAGSVMWDIGANIGLYSCYAAARGIHVIAFEPSALNMALLVEHVVKNNLSQFVTPLNLALSDTTGVVSMTMENFIIGHASNSIVANSNQFGGFTAAAKINVWGVNPSDIISRLGIPAPHAIKLDVDGAEPMIVNALATILPTIKTLMIEVEGENAGPKGLPMLKTIEESGLVEDISVRALGHGRNRLYIKD